METLATYLLKSSVWLTGFALIYVLFLRNERFFSLNRVFLVSGILASIFFPFYTWHYTVVFPIVPTTEALDPILLRGETAEEPFPVQNILLLIYLFGSFYLVFRLIKQTHSVWRIIRKSEPLHFNTAKLIHTDQYPASFSFFSFVFVNPSIDETETSEIVNHEQEHIRQRHWIDLLLFEILCTMQWFNPAIWLYGRFIRQNHEYLADEAALQRTSNPAVYRAALLNQMLGGPAILLANSFNYSINKKRFTMMKHTIKSPFRKLKLLLVLPLIAGVFYAFATPEYQFAKVESPDSELKQPVETKTVSGKVVDENGQPLKNASVIISGKTIGTVTDNDGRFMLKVTDDSPLVVSYVGFNSQKINPDFEKEMLIILKTVVISIDMVEKTASSDKGKKSSIIKTTTESGEIKLQTDSPLKFRSADGSGKQPLIVKDGVISENQNADNIPPETIESINVLKDKAATDKYGEKGKNGVVEITMKKSSDVFTLVEEMPEFPGGVEALKKFVAESLKYPVIALENGIQGQVFVNFVVAKDGSVINAKIARGVDPSLDQEALRIVNHLPKWKPGTQGGEPVDVSYSMPINFNLPEEYYQQHKESLKAKGTTNTKTAYTKSRPDSKIIGNISWINNTVYTSADLNKVFGMKKGDNYTKEQLQSIINGPVSSLYLDKGYVFSKIDISEIPTSDGVVNLTFTIYEGIRGKIGRIEVKGNKKVSTEDILQKIKIKPGDLFSKTKIVQSVEAINKMNKFNPEEIRPEIIPDSNNSNQEFGIVNIIFNVTEK